MKVKTLRGPWQEVEIRVHSLEEIDTPEFWSFLEEAVAGFTKFTDKAAVSPEDITPWKVLGQKWHFLRKGFPPGKTWPGAWSCWKSSARCCETPSRRGSSSGTTSSSCTSWSRSSASRGPRSQTKKPHALLLHLIGPKGRFGLGRVVELGADRDLDDTRPNHDVVRLQFIEEQHLHRGDLEKFLQEHLGSLQNGVRTHGIKPRIARIERMKARQAPSHPCDSCYSWFNSAA